MGYGPALKKAGQRCQQVKKSIKCQHMLRYYKDIQEFGRCLDKNPQDLASTSDPKKQAIKHKLLKSSSGSYHVLFWDDELLKRFTTNELFIDGAFKSRPNIRGVQQFLTIIGRKNNVVRINNLIYFSYNINDRVDPQMLFMFIVLLFFYE